MRDLENKEKEIIYWGMGTICNYCLEVYPDITPLFFIDSHSHMINRNLGDKLKLPEDINDWSKYYIIITIKSNKARMEIQNYLMEKGLQSGVDFCTYEDFFLCARPTTIESLIKIKAYMSQKSEISNPVMFHVPILDVRNYKVLIKFLSSYLGKREYKKNVMFTNLKVISAEFASKRLNCPVFYSPNISDLEITQQIKDSISKEDYKWLEMLELRKLADKKEMGINESLKIFYYYKNVIELIKPSKIIVWGYWNKESYILGYLADCYEISCGYMEHGWIPGTYQIDPGGIAGQSEYAINPTMFEKLKIEDVYDIERIKEYVKDQKLDSRFFVETEEDKAALLRMDKNKKTIFLVGMGDREMQMNPRSDYWKKYISNVVESTEEALFLTIKVCKKNNWNLIFKPHPGDPVPQLGELLEDVILVLDMEIDRLIKLADVVISIVSAVDYKALMYGKPLVQLGITTLLGKNCTYIVSDKEMLEKQILIALKNGMTKEQNKKFDYLLQILLQRYLWDDMSERSLRYGLTVEHDFL